MTPPKCRAWVRRSLKAHPPPRRTLLSRFLPQWLLGRTAGFEIAPIGPRRAFGG